MDPFVQFNEPAGPVTVAAGAPSVNLAGVGAVSSSATTVPVLGTLAAPLPTTGYAAGYAPATVGGVSVSVLETPACLGWCYRQGWAGSGLAIKGLKGMEKACQGICVPCAQCACQCSWRQRIEAHAGVACIFEHKMGGRP